MERCIRFFRKDDEEFAGKILINIDLNILFKKYNNIDYDPMLIYSYIINPEDEDFYSQYLNNFKFDFSNFDYFLDYS